MKMPLTGHVLKRRHDVLPPNALCLRVFEGLTWRFMARNSSLEGLDTASVALFLLPPGLKQ